LYNLVNEEEKLSIERAVDNFAGSWHEWENLEWGCVTWTCGGSASLNSYKSFRAWLETAAWDARDTEKESAES
jgi:ASC-1-like (ASCH) protein